MTLLTVYPDTSSKQFFLKSSSPAIIKNALQPIGIHYQKCKIQPGIGPLSTTQDIHHLYKNTIESLLATGGFQSWDIVTINPQHPQKQAMREKFLSEHTHAEDEVRFFAAGTGLFTIHANHQVYSLLCTQGDFINVPARTLHWFDMGTQPYFVAIRFFNNPEGWVATYSNNDIALKFPTLN